MLELRGGTAAFEIEMGRWHGVSREDRVCKECGSGEVEDVSHWLLRCAAWEALRQPLVQLFSEEEHQIRNDEQKAAGILSAACLNYSILSCIHNMWHARFCKH